MTRELKLSQIWIYPIKSLGGIPLPSATIRAKGIEHDRRWMLIDNNDTFMTQRHHPRMALFKLALGDDHLTVSYQGHSITIPFDMPVNSQPLLSKVWDDPVTVLEVGKTYNNWFSDHLKMNCRLVAFPENHDRPINPKYQVNHEHVSLADAYPFLIIGQSSLDDLNQRLATPLPMNRFRPNFVFTGGEPYEEDTWRNFTIGSNRFIGVKPSDRCVLTTVNQDTGEKGSEPLVTLATYRKRDNKIYFGQNLVAVDHSRVSVGETIKLI